MSPRPDPRLRARAVAALCVVGATLELSLVVLPHEAAVNEPVLLAISGASYLAALPAWRYGTRAPGWFFAGVVYLGTSLIAVVAMNSGGASSPLTILYLGSVSYCAYFFSRKEVAIAVVLPALSYGVLLVEEPVDVTRAFVTLGTIGAGGSLIALLVTRLDEQSRDLAKVFGTARRLARLTPSDDPREAICVAARETTGASVVVLYEPDPPGFDLVVTASAGPDRALPDAMRSVATSSFASAEPVLEDLEAGSLLCQPIIGDSRPGGVLCFGWAERVPRLTARLASVAGFLADDAALAIDRADLFIRLELAARTDKLTELPNRRSWDERPHELARAARDGHCVSVAMLDIGHFKDFNDQHGHAAGDKLLADAARAWREVTRPTDHLARYGGEEFAVILPGASLDVAAEVVQRIRKARTSGVACSAGFACWDGGNRQRS